MRLHWGLYRFCHHLIADHSIYRVNGLCIVAQTLEFFLADLGDNLGIAEPKIITIRPIYLPHCKRLTIMTTIQVGCDLTYSVTNPTSFLFNVAAARTAHQTISGETLLLTPTIKYEASSWARKLFKCTG